MSKEPHYIRDKSDISHSKIIIIFFLEKHLEPPNMIYFLNGEALEDVLIFLMIFAQLFIKRILSGKNPPNFLVK